MKKYLQISTLLGLFFVIVIWKNLRDSSDMTPVGGITQISNTANTPTPTSDFTNSTSTQLSQKYKDGTYTGSTEDAFYGNIQIQVTISNGKISDVQFLQYPNDNNTSRAINQQAIPLLKSEAIQVQNSQVDIVSGASDSSQAFQRSLENALQQAS